MYLVLTRPRKTFAGSLSIPFILHLHVTRFADTHSSIRNYAYEDLLAAYGLHRPSELKVHVNKFDRRLLVYYLRYICIPEIMQVSSAFSSSRQLEDERVSVCALLAEIDEVNAKEYEAEIRELTRLQAIKGGVRHLERSKIFVDLNAIRRWADSNIKEDFNRCHSLLALNQMKLDSTAHVVPDITFTAHKNDVYDLQPTSSPNYYLALSADFS